MTAISAVTQIRLCTRSMKAVTVMGCDCISRSGEVARLGKRFASAINCSYNKRGISFNRAKRDKTLAERGLDFCHAKHVLAGTHLTRRDDRREDGEPRLITAGMLDDRIVIIAWTPQGIARRIISMRKANGREIKGLTPDLA